MVTNFPEGSLGKAIVDLGTQIADADQRLADLKRTLARETAEIELDVFAARGEDGKPLYSNAEAREAAAKYQTGAAEHLNELHRKIAALNRERMVAAYELEAIRTLAPMMQPQGV